MYCSDATRNAVDGSFICAAVPNNVKVWSVSAALLCTTSSSAESSQNLPSDGAIDFQISACVNQRTRVDRRISVLSLACANAYNMCH